MTSSASTAKRRPRILIVDDEPSITTSLGLILQLQGFEVTTASGGLQAIEVAGSFVPDCVLSDVVMPDLNGVSASIKIARSLPDCKIILFSGQAVNGFA